MNLARSEAIHARELPRAFWTEIGGAVLIRCPQCARVFSLTNHTITAAGEVTPSVVCGHACGFHAVVTLAGYGKENRKPLPPST